jgi:G:T/U-mismatch repair DNA glycosylase
MDEVWTQEIHPDWYLDVSPMRNLILGSFPPHPAKRVYDFYYPTARNRFWKVLSDIAELPLQWTTADRIKAVQERFEIMVKLQVGVQNLGLEIKRKGKSALDTNIEIIKYHDIISIVKSHPELNKILLPGYSANHSTAASFLRYLHLNEITTTAIKPIKKESEFKIYLGNRSIDCVILNSTSTASKVKYDVLLDQFKRHLSH